MLSACSLHLLASLGAVHIAQHAIPGRAGMLRVLFNRTERPQNIRVMRTCMRCYGQIPTFGCGYGSATSPARQKYLLKPSLATFAKIMGYVQASA